MPNARRVRLALRLIAVGVVVLASLLYAGAVQIVTRNADIDSYTIGQNAVRLVERLRAVAGALQLGDVAGVRAALAQAETAGAGEMLGYAGPNGEIAALRHAWDVQRTLPDPRLIVSTREALQQAYLRVGTIAVTRGNAANADGVLAEASLLALPVASGEFERLTGLIMLAEPGRGRSRFSRAALSALFAEARLASNVASSGAGSKSCPSRCAPKRSTRVPPTTGLSASSHCTSRAATSSPSARRCFRRRQMPPANSRHSNRRCCRCSTIS